MKKIFVFFLLINIFIFGSSCKEELKDSYLTQGFEIINVEINNNKEAIDINFKYYKSLNLDEYNQNLKEEVIKVGLIIKYNDVFEIDELKVGNDNQYVVELDGNEEGNYSYSFNNDLENNYKKPITIRAYYKYQTKEGTYYRYSDKYYTKSIYELALENSGSLSDKIIYAFKEEISVVALNLDYKTYNVVCLETNYTAEVIKPLDYKVIKVLVKVSDEVKLKDDFVLKVNSLVISCDNYIVNGNQITLSVLDNKVESLDLFLDLDKQEVSIDNELFVLDYVFDKPIYNIQVTLDDKYLYHPEFVFKCNGVEISKDDYVINGQVIAFNYSDNLVASLDLLIDLDNKNVSINDDVFKLDYTIEGYNYKIKITLNEKYLFDTEFVLKRNGAILNKNDYTIDGNVITYNFSDKFIREISITLDTLNYIVSTSSKQCTVAIKKPLDYIDIITIITVNEGLLLDDNFKLIVNNVEVKKSKYSIDNQSGQVIITYKIDDPNWTKPY